jgi:hypothetical protein
VGFDLCGCMSVVMPFSTERVLLAWVEDLEQGLEEFAQHPRRPHRDEHLNDLLQSAQGLLELSQSELRKLSGTDIPLLSNDAGRVCSPDDIRMLCMRLRHIFRAGHDGNGIESTD